MRERIDLATTWINNRSPRDRLYLFIMGFLIIYMFYYLLMHRVVTREKVLLMEQLTKIQTDKAATQQQINTLTQAIQNPELVKALEEKKQLMTQITVLDTRLDKLKPRLIKKEFLDNFTDDVLLARPATIDLIQFNPLPPDKWPKNEVDRSALTSVTEELNLYQFELTFQGGYFSTIEYLRRLEKLRWPIYWDSLNYHTFRYPKANVVVRFHLLSQ